MHTERLSEGLRDRASPESHPQDAPGTLCYGNWLPHAGRAEWPEPLAGTLQLVLSQGLVTAGFGGMGASLGRDLRYICTLGKYFTKQGVSSIIVDSIG